MQSRKTAINRTNQRQPVGKSPNKTAARPGVRAPVKQQEKKQEEKKVDTRTPEEIDASYKANLAKFEAAQKAFKDSLAKKMVELAAANGCSDVITEETMSRALDGGLIMPN